MTSGHGQSSNTPSGGTKKQSSSISIPLIPRKSVVAPTAVAAAAVKKTASQESSSQRQAASTGAVDDPFARETSTALDSLVTTAATSPTGRPLDPAGSAAGASDFASFLSVDGGTSSQFAQFPQSQQPSLSLLSVFDDSGTVLQPTVLSAPLAPQPMSMNPYASLGQPNGYHPSASVMHQQQGYSSASQSSITGMSPFQHTTPIGNHFTGPTSMGFFPATSQNAGWSAPPSIHPVAGATHSSSVFSTQTHSSSIAGVNYATQAPTHSDSLYNQPIPTLYPSSQPISHINVSSGDLSNKPNPPSNPFDL